MVYHAERDRLEWLKPDSITEMEQITFGERIRHYIADDCFDGRPVVSVVSHTDVRGLGPDKADLFAEGVTRFTPRGGTISGYVLQMDIVVTHQYTNGREAILNVVEAVEKRMLELLDGISGI